ncbi:GDSL esterase/lipase At5g03610-like isoform X1 [Nymphaea colorata]|nr:GDSL esterase/lipase At5g03610-like isoform X1 [Nymphaea colorata]
MAARFLLCIILLFLLGSCIESISPHHQRPAERLFVFGDSYADTGNIARGLANCWKPPYGSTFPGKPAGRFSDGRVITDFIATFLGVPSPVPYRLRRVAGHRGSYGINFAYSGTGVFDTSAPLPNVTTQIDYLEQMIKEGWYEKRQVRSSMAFLALAGIDYLEFLLYKNGTLEGLRRYVHSVVNQTALDLRRLGEIGVGRIGVLGLGPIGCIPLSTRTLARSSCIDLLNQDAVYHNTLLHQAVDEINDHFRHRSLVAVLDVYDTLLSMVDGRNKLGPRFENPLSQCCVGTTPGSDCGDTDHSGKPMYSVCEDPGRRLFWDHGHPTQVAWSTIFQAFSPTLHQLFSQ